MDVWSKCSLGAFIASRKDWRWNASQMLQGDDVYSYCSRFVDKSHSSLAFSFGDEYCRSKENQSNEYKGEHVRLTTFKWSGSYQVADVCFPLSVSLTHITFIPVSLSYFSHIHLYSFSSFLHLGFFLVLPSVFYLSIRPFVGYAASHCLRVYRANANLSDWKATGEFTKRPTARIARRTFRLKRLFCFTTNVLTWVAI